MQEISFKFGAFPPVPSGTLLQRSWTALILFSICFVTSSSACDYYPSPAHKLQARQKRTKSILCWRCVSAAFHYYTLSLSHRTRWQRRWRCSFLRRSEETDGYISVFYWNVNSSGDRQHVCECGHAVRPSPCSVHCPRVYVCFWNPPNWKIRFGMDITCDKFKVWFRNPIQVRQQKKKIPNIQSVMGCDGQALTENSQEIRVRNKFINLCAT